MTAISIINLEFSWQANVPALLNIPALSLQQGESIFIQGSSGSGKSTLLNLIAGVNDVQKGQLNLLESPFHKMSGHKRDAFRSDHIGYIFQQFNLLPYLTVHQNTVLPCQVSKTRKANAVQHQGSITDSAKHWLNELNIPTELFHKSVSTLSVGQQQRVAAARALIGQPEIIIADEPTSSLDQDNVDNFMQLLLTECQKINATLVFVSHAKQLAKYFDRSLNLSVRESHEVV